MAYKHHQACVSKAQEDAISYNSASYDSSVIVYDTVYSYPSEGMLFYVNNLDFTSGVSAPGDFGELDDGFCFSGNVPTIAFDYEGGGPAGTSSLYWQLAYTGYLYNCDPTRTDVTFKFIYSGNIKVSIENAGLDLATSTDLNTVIFSDYDGQMSSETKVTEVSTTITNGAYPYTGAVPILIRYWNATKKPHLVCMVKRGGVDEDFVVLSTSNVTKSITHAFDTDSSAGCSYSVFDNVLSWEIKRDHDQITAATIKFFVEDTIAYNTTTEKFGDLRKGSLVEILAGYNGTVDKRFIGNVAGDIEVVRNEYGAEVTIHCEGLLSFLLDEKNYNFPNNATYDIAGYVDNTSYMTEPDGVSRPVAFDQWNIVEAIKALSIQSGIDPVYLNGKRKYYTATDDITTSDLNLLRDVDIYLSRNSTLYYSSNAGTVEEEQKYLWVYDFGQDSVYDIVKDFLSKYGYYIQEVECGDLCGCFNLVDIDSPVFVHDTVNAGESDNYTEGLLRENAEGFKVVRLDENDSTVVMDWTGKSIDVIVPRHVSFSNHLKIEYKVSSSDADWTTIAGYYNNGSFTDGTYISPYFVDADEWQYYDGINTSSGENITVFRLVFGVDENNVANTGIPYSGDHQIRFTKSTAEVAYIDSIMTYDFDLHAYKKYKTTDLLSSLSIRHELSDLRNDIFVLGASSAGFSFTADAEDLEEVQNKFITARAVDARSIYDDNYKYYVGRNKKFVIEDPTIVTQERADWLALYTLEEYRKTSFSSTFKIPADVGLQLYDNILVEDTKTDTLYKYTSLVVDSVTETFSPENYTMSVTSSSRGLPPSFRKRQEITTYELETYFNNKPIAFESVTVPVMGDKTAYDPMTSEEGFFIEFSWVQLVPGLLSTEVFDTLAEDILGENFRSGIYHNDNLIAVPFLSKETLRPGRYSVKWDGVHEGFSLNDKFSDTAYKDVLELPDGHGFFARGQNTALVDEVHPAAVMENNLVHTVKSRAFFPLYTVARFEPVSDVHKDVARVYIWGSANGTSSYNGAINDGNDISALDIQHFDLEGRESLCWMFDEDTINFPSDATSYVKQYIDPYSTDVKFSDSTIIPNNFMEGFDYTHNCMYYDARKPYGYDGTWSDYTAGHALRTLPVIDETVGVRLFIDSTGGATRRYYIQEANFIYSVVTIIRDNMDYNITRANDARRTSVVGRYQTYVNSMNNMSNPQSLSSISRAELRKPIQSWEYIADHTDRNSPESVIFTCNLSKAPSTLNSFNSMYYNPRCDYPGIGIGAISAVPSDLIKHFDKLEDLPHMCNKNGYHIWYWYGVQYSNDPQGIDNDFPYIRIRPYIPWSIDRLVWGTALTLERESWYCPHNNVVEEVLNVGTSWEYYNGRAVMSRRLYNTVLLSLDMLIFDRAGRGYFSAAKRDPANFITGYHNEVEIHSEYLRDLMAYVNRYDPYLPTACYMERSPSTFNMDNCFSAYAEDLTNDPHPLFGSNVYSGINLSEKIKNVSTFGTLTFTTPYLLNEYNHWKNPNSVPNLSLWESSYGNDSMIWSSNQMKNSSWVFLAEGDDVDAATRLQIPEGGDYQTTNYGLPLCVAGSGILKHDDRYPEPVDFYDERSAINIESWAAWYLKDINKDGQTVYPGSSRTGLFSFLSNMPIFTLVGYGRMSRNASITNYVVTLS